MMAKKSQIPRLFRSDNHTKKYMDNYAENKIQETLNSAMHAIERMKPDNVEVKRKPKYLQVTERRLRKLGVIDLKPYFAASPYRKKSKSGGWYLTVPIRRKTKSMSRRMYNQLREVPVEPGRQRTVVSQYLYDRRRQSDAKLLNYTPRSHNITKIRSESGRSQYISFRTVSDKSPISSWIINRAKVNVKDTSKTFISNVNRLMKWKMRNS